MTNGLSWLTADHLYAGVESFRAKGDKELRKYLGRVVEVIKDQRVHDERIRVLREALEEIEATEDRTVFSVSRTAMGGNEAFMLGANTAFGKAAKIARAALAATGDDAG